MTPGEIIKVEANNNRKARRSRLLKKRKAEIESESIGLSEYRKNEASSVIGPHSNVLWQWKKEENGTSPNPGTWIIYPEKDAHHAEKGA